MGAESGPAVKEDQGRGSSADYSFCPIVVGLAGLQERQGDDQS
jgi:hypothetical protein